MHELHHAACRAVDQGLVPESLCSKNCHEERVAVAHGIISGAVLRLILELGNLSDMIKNQL